MGLIRLLIFALVIWLAWRLYRIHKLKTERAREQSRIDSGKMVQCEVCGVHLPANSAISDQDHWFCSQKHLQQYRSDPDNL